VLPMSFRSSWGIVAERQDSADANALVRQALSGARSALRPDTSSRRAALRSACSGPRPGGEGSNKRSCFLRDRPSRHAAHQGRWPSWGRLCS
jgi:hypothetical protein